ncbi:CHASE3 domain-containing protein [Novosphingobium profundi]|uniref:ATP-binding protein n=1 Tax=Novosphingobium profundi TaxID=1774954 RepID=UPI001BDA30E6|nr:ATP-binding protein [Novosphingobium profundi]MBT0668019.1 CHASE3 domain-containing protein [Novosphingobium profundi]
MEEARGIRTRIKVENWRRRIAIGGVALALLVMAGIGTLLSSEARLSEELRVEELAAQDRRALIQSVLSAHQDIETGSRGYVITGKETFLEPYHRAFADLGRIEPALRRAFLDSGQERGLVESISELSRQKRLFAQATIDARRANDEARADAMISAGNGKRLMDGIRANIADLERLQSADLAEATARATQALDTQHTMSITLLVVLAILLMVAWIALQSTSASRDKVLISLQDLSSRRKAILEGAMDGIIMINPSGSMESVNPAVERMFGYEATQLERRDMGMLFANSPAVGRVAQALKGLDLPDDGPGKSQVYEAIRRDGSVFPIEVSISRTQLSEGERYVAVLRDVTERQRIEQMKSEFVSTVSHELRTPLTSIAGSLGLLRASAKGMDERAGRLVEIAHGNANRLVRLINDILDIEKMEAGRMPFTMRLIDLDAAIGNAMEAIDSYASEYGVRVERAKGSAPGPAMVSADQDRLGQVFDNLLSNAIKFSPRGAAVTLGIETLTDGSQTIGYLVSVTDRGPGIPEEFQSRVFTKFAQADSSDTRQRGGTGLGLSIVREIVRRLDGEVDFVTQPGEGTTFRVRLPAANAPKADLTRASSSPTLLVCGNGAATTFTGALRSAGYGVRLVHDLEAVKEIARHERFDGVVVDMGLPDGGGIAMIRAVRETSVNARTQILAIGAQPGESELDGDAAVVLDWLRKPVDVGRLISSVTAAADGQGGALPSVLHVEDDPDVVKVIDAALEGRAVVISANSLEAARRALAEHRFDLAVLDLELADGNGTSLLPDLTSAGNGPVPVVIFSAQDADPEVADRVEAYLTKARTPISDLVATVEALVAKPRQQEPIS